MQVIELPRERYPELTAFLAKDPVQNLCALGLLEEHGPDGLACFALLDDDRLVGAVLVGGGGGMVIPCVVDPTAATELGFAMQGVVRPRGASGERLAIEALLRGLACPPPRYTRSQRLFTASADDLGPFVCPELRAATAADLPQLVELAVDAVSETLGEGAPRIDRGAIARRVEVRVAAGRTFVLAESGRLVLKIEVGVRCRQGAEIDGLHVAPAARGRSLETLALGQLSRTLLSSLPRLVVRVDERDAALGAVCRKVGYTAMRPQRLVILD